MINRIKSSFGAKLFLYITTFLVVTSISIYLLTMYFIPLSYKNDLKQQYTKSFEKFFNKLQTLSYEEALESIEYFSIVNDAKINISIDETVSDGELIMHAYQEDGTSGINEFEQTAYVKFTDSSDKYILHISWKINGASEVSRKFLEVLPWILIVIIVISFIGAFFSSRYFAKPIKEISTVAKKMSILDMTWRCNVSRKDEIGVLSNSLNVMAGDLENALNDLSSANENLKIDIQKEQEHEKRQRDFFYAVSHELKTPIAILKGQIESMIYEIGAYKDTKKYLPRSLEVTEKMERLVNEILMISKITADKSLYKVQLTNISNIINGCIKDYGILGEEKRILYNTSIEENLYANVNEKLFKKVISNLLNNAIVYSPVGANINICLSSNEKNINFTIENTGIVIHEKDLKQIFEPFYRADKSRSRGTGGSGLGLYIVSTILKQMDMKYEISNSEDSVIFTISMKA